MKKNKEHKKGESTIGKIIYGFLLFMPLLAIGVTCGYAMFNKNAYKNISNNEEISYVQATTIEDLQINKHYKFQNAIIPNSNTGGTLTIYIDNFSSTTSSFEQTPSYISIYSYPTGNNVSRMYFIIKDANNTTLLEKQLQSQTYECEFTITSLMYGSNLNVSSYISSFYKVQVNESYYLDNVFYYSVDKVTESPLFNWAENSIIYDTLNATCTQLSITTPFIPLLLAYWLIVSIIYFLYDIALMLIWLLHDKIHGLRDSLT